jgi:hypothetical protein
MGYFCKICKKTYNSKREHDDEYHICDICNDGYFFNERAELKVHRKSEHEIDMIYCDICIESINDTNSLKTYNNHDELNEHIVNEHGYKVETNRYVCNVEGCNEVLKSKKEQLEHYRKVHKQKKAYNYCKYCNYKTYKKSNLKLHLSMKHDEGEKERCHYCDYETSTTSNLLRHLRAKHDYKDEYKIGCPYKTNKSYKKDNIEIKDGDIVYKRPECKYKAINKTQLEQHIMRNHDYLWEHYKTYYRDKIEEK